MSRNPALEEVGFLIAELMGHEVRFRAVPEWAKAYCSCGWHGPCRYWWRSRTNRDALKHARQVVQGPTASA